MSYTNSPLAKFTLLSPNHSGQRTHAIDRITPHCVVGQCSIETLGNIFLPKSREASSNYGIGVDGRIGMFVEEKNRSWCTSSKANDQRAITIECASDATAPWAFNSKVYARLIELCVDICARNGKKKLIWIADKDKALAYEPAADEMLLTVHRWFANKACPGDWLMARMDELANSVTFNLAGNAAAQPEEPKKLYRVQVGSYAKKGNAENLLEKLKAAGFNGVIVETEVEDGETQTELQPYKVRINTDVLNVRSAPSISAAIAMTVKRNGIYTIVEESDGWGKLKSGAGWIKLSYTVKV